jgi:tetratricopeptide (TPR) repeat protein
MKRQSASKNVIPFLQTANYYYKKGNQYYQQNKLEKALLFFKKSIEVEPDNALHHYNLACLLSRMGYLEKANNIFSFIVHQMDPALTECYFLMAINYGLEDDLEKSRYYLNLYLHFSPEGEMAMDAEELLYALSEEDRFEEKYPAKKLNNDQHSDTFLVEGKELVKHYAENPDKHRILWQALYGKKEEAAEKAIKTFGLLKEHGGEEHLLEFVKNPWVKQRLRLLALLTLKNMRVKGLVTVYMDESLRDIDLSYYPLLAPRWLREWQEVLEQTLKNMRLSKSYNDDFYEDVFAIWLDYLNNIYPKVPNIKKIETWSAGLEYALARYHFLNLTQKTLAKQYGVSAASISSKFRQINEVLHIEYRAYRNMFRFISEREDKE